jgi:hypothetical protein
MLKKGVGVRGMKEQVPGENFSFEKLAAEVRSEKKCKSLRQNIAYHQCRYTLSCVDNS